MTHKTRMTQTTCWNCSEN